MINKFYLFPHILFVHGARNAALYDLEKGGVYAIGSIEKALLAYVLSKSGSIEHINIESRHKVMFFLNNLVDLGLGEFSKKNQQYREEIDLSSPLQVLKQLWLSLNNNCNLRCKHCYADSDQKSPRSTIDSEKILSVIKDAKENLSLESVQLIGGEPLLLRRNQLETIIRGASTLGIPFIEVFTNGIAICDFHLRLFKECGVHVAVSIYSDRPDDHDVITGMPGSWAKTVRAIESLLRHGINVRCGVIAMEQNKNSVKRVASWLMENYGIDQGGKDYDVVRSCGRGIDKSVIPWEMFKKQYIRTEPNFLPVSKKLVQNNMHFNSCWGTTACIMPNGDVTPCEMENYIVQGNIYQDSLSSILLGRAGEIAQRLSKDKIVVCKDCEYRYACWECRAMCDIAVKENKHKPNTCLYDPYTAKWRLPPDKETFFTEVFVSS